jgi:tetratricopeptide (TPR) repeat protein
MAASGPNQTRKSLPEIYQLQVEAAERESREKWKQSLAKWLAALRENPNAPETYIEIAQCHRKLKVHEAAIAILADGIKHCDFHARLRLSYIHLLAQCNRTREAIAAAHEASLLLPQEFLWKVK